MRKNLLFITIFSLFLSCEESLEKQTASQERKLSFQPTYSLSYQESNSRFINTRVTNANGDLKRNKAAIEAPELEAYTEADVILNFDEQLNYHLDVQYTTGSPSELMPEDYFEENIYPHDPEFAVFRRVETNGVVEFYNRNGGLIERFDYSNTEDYQNWKNTALQAKVARFRAVLYTPSSSLSRAQNYRVSLLEKDGASSQRISGERLRVVRFDAKKKLKSKEIIDLKTGLLLSHISYDTEGISGRSFFKYSKKDGLNLIESEVDQSFTKMPSGKLDIFYETHIKRSNFSVKKHEGSK